MENDKKNLCVTKQLSFGALTDLIRLGVFPARLYLPILDKFRPERKWTGSFSSFFLFMAISCFCAAFCLILYQYFGRLPDPVQLCLIFSALGCCLYFLGFKQKLAPLAKRLLLLGSFFLIGLALLAIHSTFVHSYQLVLLWAILSFPLFFIFVRQSFLCLWTLLLHAGLLFWGVQVLLPGGFLLWTTFFSLISLLNFILFMTVLKLFPRFKLALFFFALGTCLAASLPTVHFILNISFYSAYSPSYYMGPALFLLYLPFWRFSKMKTVYVLVSCFLLLNILSLAIRLLYPLFVSGGAL